MTIKIEMSDPRKNATGFVPPPMTTEQRDAIPEPAAGMLVEDFFGRPSLFNGKEWVLLDDEGEATSRASSSHSRRHGHDYPKNCRPIR